MKHWKALLAIAINLALILSLVLLSNGAFFSCSAEDLYGQWTTSYPAASLVESSIFQTLGVQCDVDDSLQMVYLFHYREDGIMTVTIEEASAREIIEAQLEALTTVLPELFYAQFQQDGMSREEVDAALASYNLDMEGLVQTTLDSQDFESLLALDQMTATMYYAVVNGELCYAASPEDLQAGRYEMTVKATVRGNALTLSDARDGEGDVFEGSGTITYPVTLTRK